MDNNTKRTEKISIIFIGFLAAFMLCIFAPLEFYLSNKGYFFFSGGEMIPFILIIFTSVFVCELFVLFTIHHLFYRTFKMILGFFFGIILALYIQGNYIVIDYGAMDGRTIEWENYKLQGIVSVIVFLLIIILSILLAVRIKRDTFFRITKIVSICLVLVQMVTLGTLLINQNGLNKEAEYVATEDGEFSLSKDENIIILLLDTYDSKLFSNMFEGENAEQYKDILQDFTYYPDTVAGYAATDLAVPCIITGDKYQNDEEYGSYLRKAYGESSFLKKLNEEGWYCGIYSECMPPQGEEAEIVDNFLQLERTVSSHRRLAEYMYKFVGFRYLPQPLKKYCWFYPEEMRSEIECTVDSEKTLFNDNNFYFYDHTTDIKADNAQKTFHFYHLDGTHAPYTINSDFTGADKEVGIEAEAQGMMILIAQFLEQLKSVGAYDNSTIMIMADHGFYDMRQNPLYLVKSKNENQPFSVSQTPISFFDLQEIYLQIINGTKANIALNTLDNQERDREFFFYSWDLDMGEESYSTDIRMYNVKGKAWEKDAYFPTGTVYSAPK